MEGVKRGAGRTEAHPRRLEPSAERTPLNRISQLCEKMMDSSDQNHRDLKLRIGHLDGDPWGAKHKRRSNLLVPN